MKRVIAAFGVVFLLTIVIVGVVNDYLNKLLAAPLNTAEFLKILLKIFPQASPLIVALLLSVLVLTVWLLFALLARGVVDRLLRTSLSIFDFRVVPSPRLQLYTSSLLVIVPLALVWWGYALLPTEIVTDSAADTPSQTITNGDVNQTVIQVVGLFGPERPDPVTDYIVEALKNYSDEYPSLVVKRDENPISIEGGSEEAQRRGYSAKSSLVIWGRYDETSRDAIVKIFVEIIDLPQTTPQRLYAVDYRMPAVSINRIEVRETVGSDIGYLATAFVGLSLYKQGRNEEALKLISMSLNSGSIMKNVAHLNNLLLARQYIYGSAGETDKALADLRSLLQTKNLSNHTLKWAYYYIGAWYYKKRMFSPALRNLRIALRYDRESFEILYGIALVNQMLRNFDLALAYHRQASSTNPRDYRPYFETGTIYLLSGDYLNAGLVLQEAVRLSNKKDADLLNTSGVAYYGILWYQDALNCFTASLNINPYQPYVYRNIAVVLSDMGDFEGADFYIREGLKIDPQNEYLLLMRAALYLDFKEYDRAIAVCEAILSVKESADAYFLQGIAFIRQNQNESALRVLNKAIETSPDMISALRARAEVYGRLGEVRRQALDQSKLAKLQRELDVKKKSRTVFGNDNYAMIYPKFGLRGY